MAHQHECPWCGHVWWCEPASHYAVCANKVANGNNKRSCDLCKGWRRPAREPNRG